MKQLLFAITFFATSFIHSQTDHVIWFDYGNENKFSINIVYFDEFGTFLTNERPCITITDTTHTKILTDTFDLSPVTKIYLSGTSTQYLRGDGQFTTFPEIPTNTNQLTNGAAFLVSSDIAGKLNVSDTSSMLSPYLESLAAASTYATISGLNAKQGQISGTGLVKFAGTSYSFDNNTYLTAEVDGSVTNEIELPSMSGNNDKMLTVVSGAAQWVLPVLYTAGTGISISSGIITNTAPDQTVSISAGSGMTVTGTYPNFTIEKTKRQETYIGTTNGSGIYAVTYSTPFSSAPCLSYSIIGGAIKEEELVTSTTTGFSINVQLRTDLIGLLPTYANVSGRTVNVTVTEM